MTSVQSLEPKALYRRCDPTQFTFQTTAELDDLGGIIGQKRAVDAVRFAIGMRQEGYNLFALGPNGTGKYTAVRRFLEDQAAAEQVPPDWCYVYHFDHPHQPRALSLPAGRGERLAKNMAQLVEECLTVIPAAFESEEYQAQKQAIADDIQHRQEEALEALAARAVAEDVALIRTPGGLAFAPIKNGQTLSPEDFQKLSEEEKEEIQTKIFARQEELQKIIRQMPQLGREGRERIKALDREVASFSVTPLITELRQKYDSFPTVLSFLDAVEQDIVSHLDQFLGSDAQPVQMLARLTGRETPPGEASPGGGFLNRYEVNVLVNHAGRQGAPIIYEDHPTHQNLVGRVEHFSQMGALLTDFTFIKAGALHRANGGYLILDARKLLTQPYAWESLKRALKAESITIESLGQSLSLISTVSLEPEPVPLAIKVVLLGDRLLYYLLSAYDPEFEELFKVAADFEDEMPRSEETQEAYARVIAALVRKNELRPFTPAGVARVIEHGSRLAQDAEKLTTHMQSIVDLLRESSYWAGEFGRDVAGSEDVQRALDDQQTRSGRLRERLQEMILRQTVLIDTEGARVGQINGLSVLQLGSTAFARPSRITARIQLGKGEVIDIERQVELGGPLHSKGVLILAGFLGGRYGADLPLSFSATLVFEQSYGGVDGDSASSAELYALLSALADVPLRQGLAVTGSVNQHGEVQAIGGVNEKIEGFFDICQARNLTGRQGVLIPAANVKNLMLRQDVVAAAAEGQFHIYPIETIDQGIELLTGLPAGEKDGEGAYPPDSVNGRVAARLAELVAQRRKLAQPLQGAESHD